MERDIGIEVIGRPLPTEAGFALTDTQLARSVVKSSAKEVFWDKDKRYRVEKLVAFFVSLKPHAVDIRRLMERCARAVIQLRREQGKRGADATFASEQFDEMWLKEDRTALDSAREFDAVLRDVAKTCIAVARKGAIEAFRDEDVREQRALRTPNRTHRRQPRASGRSDVGGWPSQIGRCSQG